MMDVETLSSEQTYNMTNEEIKNYTQLRSLYLAYNSSIADEGISVLTNLTHLDLSFSGTITCDGLKPLTNLTSLNLKSNSEESFTIVALNSLPALKHVYTDSKKLILNRDAQRKFELRIAM